MNDNLERPARPLGRIVGFSDGIFAFAMTLLAVDLRLPAGTTAATLPAQLAALGPHLFAFALSFAVIGLYWSAHRRLFRYIERSDERLTYMNLALLLTVAFMPFPTAVYGQFGNTSAAALLYTGTLASTAFMMAVIWLYATHGRRLVSADLDARVIRQHLVRALAGFAVFGLSIPVALVDPPAARTVWFALGAVILIADLAFNGEWLMRRRETR